MTEQEMKTRIDACMDRQRAAVVSGNAEDGLSASNEQLRIMDRLFSLHNKQIACAKLGLPIPTDDEN